MFLDATQWLDIQDTNATNEKRFSELGIIDLVKNSTPFANYVSPSAQDDLSKVSSLRNVKIPVIVDQIPVVLTTPGFNFIPANLPTTDQYYFVAYDVFSGFRHYPAAYENNTVGEAYAIQEVMKNVAFAMGQTVEGILQTTLEARKSQVINFTTQVSQGDGTYNFNTGSDVLEVSKLAQKETMFYNLSALMNANVLGGNYALVTSPGGMAVQKAEMLKYGTSNMKDIQALGFLPMDRVHESHTITPGSNIFNGYFVRDGAIGVFENFPYDFRNGTSIAGKTWSISQTDLPYVKMRANLYVNNEPTEGTALISAGTDSNLIMTSFHEMGIWLRFYIAYRYNSNLATRANDIVKISGLTT